MSRDDIYTDHIHNNGFSFDHQVASVFADMIQRSVPGYGITLQMVELLAHQYAQPDSNLYDLGCSLGASTLALRKGCTHNNCQIIGIDNSEAMTTRCQKILAHEHVTIHCQDILDADIENASVVVLNFVLQFIDPQQRHNLLHKIYAGMRPGGILILSEKIAFEDDDEQQRQIALHEAFKRAEGYSDMEISRKRAALEHVLVPETVATHRQRLASSGFSTINTWFQCFNFTSLLAIK